MFSPICIVWGEGECVSMNGLSDNLFFLNKHEK